MEDDYNLRLCVVMAIVRSRPALSTDLQSIPLEQFVRVLGYIHSDLDVGLAQHLGSIRPQELIDRADSGRLFPRPPSRLSPPVPASPSPPVATRARAQPGPGPSVPPGVGSVRVLASAH